MTADMDLQKAKELLKPWARETKTPERDRLDVWLPSDDLLQAVAALCEWRWGYLAAITGLDLGAAAGEIEVLYHFCLGAAVTTLRVRTLRTAPEVPGICAFIPGASFFERELAEMFGVKVRGADYPKHLFLPDDWPDGIYPLRKDFQPTGTTQSIAGT